MNLRNKYIIFKGLAMLLMFFIVFSDVCMHFQPVLSYVMADEDDDDFDGDNDNDDDDPDIPFVPVYPDDPDEPDDPPYQPEDINLVIKPSTQISFATITEGTIVNPVRFTVTNPHDAASLSISCVSYGLNPDAFIIDLPENNIIGPGETLSYYVTVNQNLLPDSYECSYVLTPALYGDLPVGRLVNTIAAAVKCNVTVVPKSTPKVDSVSISPDSGTVKVGSSCQFQASVTGDVTDKSVSWSVTGANSPGTTISDGILSVDANESAASLTVFAKANADPDKYASAPVTVQKADEYYSINAVSDPWNGGVVSGSGNYKKGSQAVLTASANNGFSFKGWVVDNKLQSTNVKYYIDNVSSNMTVTAQFEENKAYVYVESSNTDYGTVSDSGYVTKGQSYTVKAYPKDGYRFVGWKENNNIISRDSEFTLNNVSGTRKLTAVFEPSTIQINICSNPSNGGSISGAGTYGYGKDAAISATPSPGYRFVGWLHDNNYFSNDTSYTLYDLKRDYSIVAVFEPANAKSYNITTRVAGGKGIIYPSGTFPVVEGNDIAVTVTPSSGYQVKSLVVDGINQGVVPGYVFKNVSAAHTVEVVFEAIPGSNNDKGSQKDTNKDSKEKKEEKIVIDREDSLNPLVDNGKDKSSEPEQKPDDDPVIPVYDHLAVNPEENEAVSGILQEYGLTREQGKKLIADHDELAYKMFDEAYAEGYFNVTINNEFSKDKQETSKSVFDVQNLSIPNFIEVATACISLDEGVEAIAGGRLGFNLNISGYDTGVPEIVKNELDLAAEEYGQQVCEYMDIFFAKSVNNNTTPISESPIPLEIIIDIPTRLKGLSDDFSIVRVHRNNDGSIENTLLKDEDDNPDTITIHTDKFSSYGIVMAAAGEVNNTETAEAPKTESQNTTTLIMVIAVVVAAIIASIFIALKIMNDKKRKKNRHKH